MANAILGLVQLMDRILRLDVRLRVFSSKPEKGGWVKGKAMTWHAPAAGAEAPLGSELFTLPH